MQEGLRRDIFRTREYEARLVFLLDAEHDGERRDVADCRVVYESTVQPVNYLQGWRSIGSLKVEGQSFVCGRLVRMRKETRGWSLTSLQLLVLGPFALTQVDPVAAHSIHLRLVPMDQDYWYVCASIIVEASRNQDIVHL